MLVSNITLKKQIESRIEEVIKSVQLTKMVGQKSGPSFASILTILSFVMNTGGFVRIEVEFNKQKDKIKEFEKKSWSR